MRFLVCLFLLIVPARKIYRKFRSFRIIFGGVLSGSIHTSVRFDTVPIIKGHGTLEIGRGVRIGSDVIFNLGNSGHIALNENCSIAQNCGISVETQVLIGSGTRINRDCQLTGGIDIGKDCILANGVNIISTSHRFIPGIPIDIADQKYGLKVDKVVIDANCFVGAHAILLGAINCGKSCIIGAKVKLQNVDVENGSLVK